MTTGNYREMKLVFERKAGAEGAEIVQPNIKVWKSGPFYECYVNDILIGKVMKLSECYVTPAMTKETEDCIECSGRCIILKHHIIVLSMAEYIDMLFEMNEDAEKRAEARAVSQQ